MDNKQELLEAACRTFNTFTSPSRQFVHKVQFYINWSTLHQQASPSWHTQKLRATVTSVVKHTRD